MMERGITVIEQYVTRTLQIVEARAWKPTGTVLPDGSPEQVCVGKAEMPVTRINKGIARQMLRDEGVDLGGCTITWEVTHIGTYGQPVMKFFAEAVPVTRAANGDITLCDE